MSGRGGNRDKKKNEMKRIRLTEKRGGKTPWKWDFQCGKGSTSKKRKRLDEGKNLIEKREESSVACWKVKLCSIGKTGGGVYIGKKGEGGAFQERGEKKSLGEAHLSSTKKEEKEGLLPSTTLDTQGRDNYLGKGSCLSPLPGSRKAIYYCELKGKGNALSRGGKSGTSGIRGRNRLVVKEPENGKRGDSLEEERRKLWGIKVSDVQKIKEKKTLSGHRKKGTFRGNRGRKTSS